MTVSRTRLQAAVRFAGFHLMWSIALAMAAGVLIFGLWYPYPYRELAGGKELFILIIMVDVVTGPLLTSILFNPSKPRKELWLDISLVVLIQISALGYGAWTLWQARPLFLALEFDRFKVVMSPDLDAAELKKLPLNLQPRLWEGPKTVALRPPKDVEEKNKVLFASLKGGRDYAERPEFYLPYEGAAAMKALNQSKPIAPFLDKYPEQRQLAQDIASVKGSSLAEWRLLPVTGRQDWVALLDKEAKIQGFLKGDAF
jgi:hypothetical protein